MSQLLVMLASALATLIVPLVIGAIIMRRGQWRSKDEKGEAPPENCCSIDIYSYEPDVVDMRDIFAKRMSLYRDTGRITGLEDDAAVCSVSYERTPAALKELGMINRCAEEVKRLSAYEIIYFFSGIRPLKIKTRQAQEIFQILKEGLEQNKTMLLRLRN